MHRGIETTVWDGSGVKGLPQWLSSKVSASNAGATGDGASIPVSESPLEEKMATHSSMLSRKIPRTEEAGGHRVTNCSAQGHKEADRTELLNTVES